MTANTFTFTTTAGKIHEYTTDNWTHATDFTPATTAGSISVGNTDIAVNQLQVRIKETDDTLAGSILTNAQAFTAVFDVTFTVLKNRDGSAIAGASIAISGPAISTVTTAANGMVTTSLRNGAYVHRQRRRLCGDRRDRAYGQRRGNHGSK